MLLSIKNGTTAWKINWEIKNLKNTANQILHTYKDSPPNNSRICIFLSVCGTFSRIGHLLGLETSLNKFKKTEVI